MRAFRQNIQSYVNRAFGLDIRALAVFRISLALIVLADLCRRAGDLHAHYTDAGIWPTAAAWEHSWLPFLPSLHLLDGSFWFQAGLFLLAGFFALQLLVGYRTTVATVATWFLLLSLHHSNPLILQRGDVELLLLMFWGMFLPLGATFSIDRASRRLLAGPRRVLSLASVGLTLQVLYIYFFAFFLKSSDVWKVDFDGVQFALLLDQHVTAFGSWLAQFDGLTTALTIAVLAVQLVALPLVLAPLKQRWVRDVMVTLLALTHIGYLFTLHLGLFPFISLAGLVVLYSERTYDFISRWLFRKEPISIYYDRDCGFCRKSVWLIKTFFLVPVTRIAPAQIDPAVWETMQREDSWVVTDGTGRHYTTFAAGVRIAESSGWLSWLAVLARPRFMQWVGEWTYRAIAHNRRSLPLPDTAHSRGAPRPPGEAKKALTAAFLLWALVAVTASNIDSLRPGHLTPYASKVVSSLLRLEQNWGVFAPRPRIEDGWYVVAATTTAGRSLDAWNGGVVSYEKPESVAATYRNQRWRKYLTNLAYPQYAFARPHFAAWLCREWEQSHPTEPLTRLTVAYLLELTTKAGERAPESVTLIDYNCQTGVASNIATELRPQGIPTQKGVEHQQEDEGDER